MHRRSLLQIALIFGLEKTIFAIGWEKTSLLSNIDKELETIANIQEILLPSSEKYPGAKDINAIGYIKVMIHGKIFSDKETKYLVNNANAFNIVAYKKYKKTFNELDQKTKEKFIKIYIKKKKNLKFIKTVKRHTLFALMSDPIYGGNRDQIGWKWLKVTPSQPRPTKRIGV